MTKQISTNSTRMIKIAKKTIYLGGMCGQLTVVESPIPQLDFAHPQPKIISLLTFFALSHFPDGVLIFIYICCMQLACSCWDVQSLGSIAHLSWNQTFYIPIWQRTLNPSYMLHNALFI